MSNKTSFAEISPSEFKSMYEAGMSIDEVARQTGRSYTYTRDRLIEARMTLRSKADGTRLFISKHPEWRQQFVKYRVENPLEITEKKSMVLAMVVTEGYTDATSFGFTNSQELIHDRFRSLVTDVFGSVLIGRNHMTSRVSSTEISRVISAFLPDKTFSPALLDFILRSPGAASKVLRIIADTEGSMLISVKKASRNFTVESRIVLASSNLEFTRQIVLMLESLGIGSKPTEQGAIIGRKRDITRFVQEVGFSPGVRVVRRNFRNSLWYGYEKSELAKLFQRISLEQGKARAEGRRGSFADCFTKQETVLRLREWCADSNGGDPI